MNLYEIIKNTLGGFQIHAEIERKKRLGFRPAAHFFIWKKNWFWNRPVLSSDRTIFRWIDQLTIQGNILPIIVCWSIFEHLPETLKNHKFSSGY